MRILFLFYCLALPILLFSQEKDNGDFESNSKYNRSDTIKKSVKKSATIDLYKVISIDNDTTYIDTSLTIQKEYSHNYLRKDIFGLLPFANDGQTYNTLQYSLTDFSPYPEFGFKAKHFNFLEANQIRYYSVATPVTELYFKTTVKKGQSVDAFITLNTSENLNFSIAYKGLRSEGEYLNQLSSTGNFRFTTNYNTKNKRYFAKAHYTFQDILNEENGGITTIENFESEDPNYNNRQRFEVYFNDAKSFLKGKRIFLDHNFRINSKKGENNLYLTHQFNYENKFFEYNQETVPSTVGSETVYRFGDSFLDSGINDQTRYNKMYNRVGLIYENTTLGIFQFFVDDFRSNYYYNKILIFDNQNTIPSSFSQEINSAGGQYEYRRNKWNGKFLYSRSVTAQSLSNLDAKLQYELNDEIQLAFQYQNINKLPNNNYNLHQSSFVQYNWSNDFKNEKINTIKANAISPWIDAELQLSVLNDHLYFTDVGTAQQKTHRTQIVAPAQYNGTINYLSLKISRELKFGNFALDNTILYQKTEQQDAVLNVPEIVTRNTIYYTNYLFKKALFLQTGISLNYFSSYYANEYNPVIGEFFVQNEKQIGNHTNLDFFINAKIQRTRIYFKAEHFNSALMGNNFYASPNNPSRDFTIRFGLIWNFFN
ncbi:putative porin [Flavobacterium sinopsychrotolerans]|uniref:Putative porin n=1 Tax=Flavobacterium sinopsychrotolerans TaxID=604089 RepID=A0A1H8HY79_9FLAO|nr:putative porin [Flavobacterium sinopsychrotolerans]SEN61007.1 Putative porin [Flavobacterium sinopsychrotolerans]